ncbi:MAG: GDYXXLXY domain-containing protein [Siculibacillus sp.]|nr:GDYXXLXY domain-containing protein [Siculibacillus sp.]
MRRILFVVVGVAILAFLGWRVRDAEALIASGEVVLLELAPVDPRSLIQGDYMRLSWAAERRSITIEGATGTIVLGLDARRVGDFRRLATAGAAGEGELAFDVRRGGADGRIAIEPHSFLFQEGHADLYAKAKYGIFRVDPAGRHLLTGLADAEGRRIDPP